MAEHAIANRRFAALTHRNFVLLWVGLIISNIGSWMQSVAQAWLLYNLTNSALMLGLLGLSFAVPMIVLPLFGGAVADRVHRIRLIAFTQTVQMIGAALLAWLVYVNRIQVWEILAVSFVGSCMLALDNPTRQSLVPDLVPRRDLLNAVSINSAAWNGAALVGPALAGALLPIVGAGTLFLINALSFLAVLIAISLFRNVPAYAPGENHAFGLSVMTGLRFALRSRLILGLLLISTVISLFGRSYTQLLPIFARDIYRAGPSGYGLLLTAGGLGALIGAFGLASLRGIHREGVVLVIAGLVAAAGLVAFSFAPSLWVALLLLVVVGIATTVVGTIIATLLQLQAPGEMRGRVMSLYAITLIGIPSLGALGVAALATQLGGAAGGAGGAPRAIVLGSVLMAVCVLLVAPRLWQLRGMTGRPERARPADGAQQGAWDSADQTAQK